MPNKIFKNPIYFLLIFSLIIIFFSYFFINKVDNLKTENPKIDIFRELPKNNIPSQQEKILENKEGKIKVTLKILDKQYNTLIAENENVYNLMRKTEEENKDFSFNGKNYLGLGFFIEEINGIRHSDGKYWIYYVNNKEASVGVSDYKLKEGDNVLWTLE